MTKYAENLRWNNVPDCRDREFWSKLKSHPQFEALLKEAENAAAAELVSPLPWYLECSINGNRTNYQARFFEFRHFGALTALFCVTGEKRFLSAVEKRLHVLLSLPSWTLPAHDLLLECYKGEARLIDLFAALLGGELATVLYVLYPVLDKALAERLEKELFRRILIPIEMIADGKAPASTLWWLNGSNNWNPVCKQGVISMLLRLDIAVERKEKIIKFFFDNFENYMASFGGEGYCDEGLSYWAGSCGEYLLIAALLKQYDGRDVLSGESRMLKALMYPENIMMSPGFYPAYTDCAIDIQPRDFIMQLRDITFGKRKGFTRDIPLNPGFALMCLQLGYGFDDTPQQVVNDAPFSTFPEAGCFVMRQTEKSPLSVSFKGGSNRESHNHNDVGTYIIAVDGVPVVLDPGGEIYSARTFTARRYDSNLLNSYGHSVPRIDGRMQTNMVGTDAMNPPRNSTPVEKIKAVLLEQDVSADHCRVKFDISRVYNHIDGIEKLERTFEFDREKSRFTVCDSGNFARQLTFDDAVITLGNVTELGGGKYRIEYEGKALLLTVSGSGEYDFSIDTIMENTTHKKPVYRLSFALKEAVQTVEMKFIFTVEK